MALPQFPPQQGMEGHTSRSEDSHVHAKGRGLRRGRLLTPGSRTFSLQDVREQIAVVEAARPCFVTAAAETEHTPDVETSVPTGSLLRSRSHLPRDSQDLMESEEASMWRALTS